MPDSYLPSFLENYYKLMSDREILDMKNRVGTIEDAFYTIHLADGELSPCHDLDSPELISTLRQKDKQLTLAAKLGKALLEENQTLKEEKDRLQEGFMKRIEELQQDNHELRMKYEVQEVEWDARVYELEQDAQELQEEMTKMRGKLLKADKGKAKAVQDLTEKNQRLTEQLNKMLQAEQGLVAEVQALKEDSRDGVQSFYREVAQTHVLQQEVVELAQQKHDLEQQLAAFVTQNALLQNTIITMKNELSALDRHSQDQLVQIQQSEQNSKDAWALNRELQAKLQEIQEETLLRGFKASDSSLLSELEESLDAESWDNNQMINAVQPHDQPCPLCQRRSKDLQNVSEHQSVLEKLQSENEELKQENSELMMRLEESHTEKGLQSALRERDTAIEKKTAIEAELMTCKDEVQFLTHQLLETIQQKVELSQQLEAWQEDMQLVINQQLKAQQQRDEKRKHTASQSREKREASKLWNPFQRSNNTGLTENNGFFSIFKR